MFPQSGRKWTMVVSSGLMGASILLLSKADTIAKNEGLFALQYFFQSMFDPAKRFIVVVVFILGESALVTQGWLHEGYDHGT